MDIENAPITTEAKKKRINKKLVLMAVVGVVVLAAIGWLGWQLRSTQQDNDVLKKQVASLQTQLFAAKKALADSSTDTSKTSTSEQTATKSYTPTASMIETITASMNTMNTQPLESYMASSVDLVPAASEPSMGLSATAAVKSLDYFQSAKQPWDFNLSASVLSSYGKSAYYGTYFGDNTLAGRSSDGMAVSFHFNSSGKIDRIFILASEDLL